MVGIPGPTLDYETRAFLTEFPVGGIVLFKRNVLTAAQLRRLVTDLHATGAGVPPLVAIDHEGGRVHRLRRPFTHFPAAAQVGRHRDPRLAEAVGLAMGRELAAVGIDLNFAPVLDVWSNPRNQVIGDRAYASTPDDVGPLALAMARGLLRGGVLPCGKHFPGHGDTLGDSHFVLPTVRKSRAELNRVELMPFRHAIRGGLPALMTSHVVFPALDPKRPGTLSARICRDLLRRQLGFRGILFSDDMEMHAVAGRRRPGAAAVEALRAGCDMLLVCQSLAVARDAMTGVERALTTGRLEPKILRGALGRLQEFRRLRPTPRRPTKLAWPAHTRLARRLA